MPAHLLTFCIHPLVCRLRHVVYLYFIQMKALYNNFGWALCMLIAVATASCVNVSNAQESSKDVSGLINSKRYVFIAQMASPVGGQSRQLTSEYDLKVRGDSIIAYLPYFGRAYTAPADPSKGGIQFTSTDNAYTQSARKKGGWDINIKPNDAGDVRQMVLSVTSTGNATLQVISNNRQTISFNGYIAERAR